MERLTPEALAAHGAFVLTLARRLTRDEASALDLRQDTLVTALQSAPRDRSVRGWLARAVRSRKVDQDRRDAGRRHREGAAARSEALAHDSAAQLQQLELGHSIVQAVLDLDEPYRSVVVDVYYGGLTPGEIAERSGANAATVRSQLSRAHDRLRLKLDRQHGQRSLWTVPLMAFIEREQALPAGAAGKAAGKAAAKTASKPALKTGAKAATSASPFSVGGWPALAIGALGLSVGGLWLATHGVDRSVLKVYPADGGSERAAATAQSSSPNAEPGLPAPVSLRVQRQALPAEPVGELDPGTANPPTGSLPTLLSRVRKLRTEILRRAMLIEPVTAERFAWLEGQGGVIRLLNRERYGMDWSLPWMKGGGGFYSFSRRSRHASSTSQLSFMGRRLYHERHLRAGLCLGQLPLRSVPVTGTWTGPALSGADALEFERAWAAPHTKPHADSRSEDPPNFFLPEVGNSYLLRTAKVHRFDALVAYEVLALDGEGCTLAWRLLKEWPTEKLAGEFEEAPTWPPSEDSHALADSTDEQLRSELAAALEEAQQILFESHPAAIEESYGSLRDQEGCGLARLLAFEGPWCELMAGEGHGAEISPLTGIHDEQHAYLGYRLENGKGELTPSLSCQAGLVCDLGPVPLDGVKLPGLMAHSEGNVNVALDRQTADAAGELRRRLSEAAIRPHATAIVGHTYLVRSVRSSDRNLLFAVHVAALDDYGAIVAWRILDNSAP